jgi:hypothetical protein
VGTLRSVFTEGAPVVAWICIYEVNGGALSGTKGRRLPPFVVSTEEFHVHCERRFGYPRLPADEPGE